MNARTAQSSQFKVHALVRSDSVANHWSVIFSPYDLEEYSKVNGLLDDYRNLVPSPICNTPEDIFLCIAEAIINPDKYQEQRQQAKRKYLGSIGPGASERILSVIKNQ